jgi:phage tail-like protein
MRRQAIERLLPAVYQRTAGPDSVLGAVLEVMEQMHAPDEERLETVDDLFSPYRTPDRFVAFLAGWVALDPFVAPGSASGLANGHAGGLAASVPVGRLRDLVATGAEMAQWRGTGTGLIAMIESALGIRGVQVQEPPGRAFHIVVRVPAAAAGQLDLVRRVTEAVKPAATTYEVSIMDTQKEPS